MKTKVAMLISIAGVLVAGSAAALVNNQVLGGSSSTSPLVVDNAVDAPEPTASTTATTIATVITSSPPATSLVPSQAASVATQASYAIGDAGTVTLDTAGDVLTIVSVVPTAGWTTTNAENQDPTNVEITLQSATVDIEFHANLQFGVVTTSTELHDGSATVTSVDDHGGGNGGNSGSGSGGSGGDDNSGHGGGGDD
ncbi:MAG TPA: hypothetical protein VGC84_05210 [Ilumatobacteraceae bacterium]|jgi:hypothetical protein